MIVDLRLNGGGDNTTYGTLFATLTESCVKPEGAALRADRARNVLGGRRTSPPTSTGSRRRRSSESRPAAACESYGDIVTVLLPKSGINVRIAARYWDFGKGSGDRRLAINPDRKVIVTVADFLAGRDPVLARGTQGLTSANCGRFVRGTPCARPAGSHSVVLAPSTGRE